MTDNIKPPPLPEGNVAHLIAAQAAEIERLRAEVEEWKDVARCASEQQDSLFREARALSERADKLRAERDALREALKERIYALEADLDTAQHADHEETIRALVVAADRLAALEAELASMRADRYESRASTHADDCWSWGPGHYKCAVGKIERLLAEAKKLREALEDADNELDWLDEDIGIGCDHSAGVCTCDYWRMRRKMKAALSKETNHD